MPESKPKPVPACHPDRPYKALDMCQECYSRHRNGVKKQRRHAAAKRMLSNELLPGAKKRNHKKTGNPIGRPRENPIPLAKQPISEEAMVQAEINPEITIPKMEEVTERKLLRGEDGRILPGSDRLNPNKQSPAHKMAAWFRDKLAEIDPKDKQGLLRMEVMFLNLYKIASDDSPKSRKESIWAFNALTERAFGRPLKDQSELDALAKSGVQFIFAAPPVIDNSNVPVPLQLSSTPVFDNDGYELSSAEAPPQPDPTV